MIIISEYLKTDKLMGHKRLRDFVLSCMKKGKFCPVMALGIFLPQNPDNLFEIISLNELMKPPFKNLTYEMVGLAGSRVEAFLLVARLWKEGRISE